MTEDIKTRFRRIVDEAWNKGNLDALEELHNPEYTEHHAPFPDVTEMETFKQMVADTRATYPDFHITIHDLVLEGDRLASRWTWQGTHLGKTRMLNIPPTGRKVTVHGSHILKIRDGKLSEGWQFADDIGLLRQLGVIPETK